MEIPTTGEGKLFPPSDDTIIEDAWATVSVLSSERFVTVMPALVERLRNRGLRSEQEARTLLAITNALQESIDRQRATLADLKPFLVVRFIA